jgi:propanol-preferring alcohol dehydrogenase
MKGVVVIGNRKVELREVEKPQTRHCEVLVRAVEAGVCGSDMFPYRAAPNPGRSRLVQGHELVGVVEELGPGAEHLQVGDRVFVYLGYGCFHCEACASGYANLCPDRRDQGKMDRYQKPYSVVREEMALRIPDEMTFEDALMLTCAGGTAWSALQKVEPTPKDAVVIFGLGPVGLMGVMWAKTAGAYVIGVEPIEERQALARKVGADVVLAPQEEEIVERIRALTNGDGATVGYESSGSKAAKAALLNVTSRDARIVYVAGGARGPVIDPSPFGQWGTLGLRTIYGTVTHSIPDWYDMTRTILMQDLKPGEIVTHRFSIEEASEAYALTDSGRCGKVVFEWPLP